mmetsp:Transcript_64037/g.176988  ORF Transcript_64037/g.176988 Transcript_64037/m.176988 type:complete len:213 (+) Transcript_64037:363-1001(+)
MDSTRQLPKRAMSRMKPRSISTPVAMDRWPNLRLKSSSLYTRVAMATREVPMSRPSMATSQTKEARDTQVAITSICRPCGPSAQSGPAIQSTTWMVPARVQSSRKRMPTAAQKGTTARKRVAVALPSMGMAASSGIMKRKDDRPSISMKLTSKPLALRAALRCSCRQGMFASVTFRKLRQPQAPFAGGSSEVREAMSATRTAVAITEVPAAT